MRSSTPQEIAFTREQFYEKLWSTPTVNVAKELGCSDVLIGKICREFNIPKPYLGYWAKVQHGKKPKKTPLPRNDDPDLQTLVFYKYPEDERSSRAADSEPPYDPDIQQLLERARSLKPLRVSGSLRDPHPLVVATRDRLKVERIPLLERPWHTFHDQPPSLDVEASPATESRALRIMDALVKRIEKIGGSVEIEGRHPREQVTAVHFGGELATTLRLREKHNQVRVPREKRDILQPAVELEPNGLLVLDKGPSSFERHLLRDTPKRKRLEDGLNDLVIDLVKEAGRARIRRRKEAEDRRRREEAERIRREKEEQLRRKREALKKRQQAEQARIDDLVDQAEAWQKSRLLRAYLDAWCETMIDGDGAVPLHGETADYLRWAHQQADRLDPLRPTLPSVLDEAID